MEKGGFILKGEHQDARGKRAKGEGVWDGRTKRKKDWP